MSVYQVCSEISGTVWKVQVGLGDKVAVGDEIMVIESMKMEIPVIADEAGVVESISGHEGASVIEGDVLLSLAVAGGGE